MPPGDMVTALRDHQVSAIVATQPYILQAETELGPRRALRRLQRRDRQPAALRLLHQRRLRPRSCRGAAAFPGPRSTRAKAGHGPARHRPLGLGTLPGMSARDAALVTIGQYPTFLSVGQVQRVADLMYGTGMILTRRFP